MKVFGSQTKTDVLRGRNMPHFTWDFEKNVLYVGKW